jgi:hypothetical protein
MVREIGSESAFPIQLTFISHICHAAPSKSVCREWAGEDGAEMKTKGNLGILCPFAPAAKTTVRKAG